MNSRELRRVLLEVSAVSALGLAFGLAANLVSPRGLSLTRNYFPDAGGTSFHPGQALPSEGSRTSPAAGGQLAHTNSNVTAATLELVAAGLKRKGLQPIDREETLHLFRDPQYEQELIVFVDARDDRHYREGHIPGAYQFDRYYPEKHLPTVLPACLNAAKIVVYCTGGNCEDSEFAALALKESGVPQERLFVYAGGMSEWAANGLPVELAGRKSGNTRGAKP